MTIEHEKVLVAGHVPEDTVKFLQAQLGWGWKNRTVQALCATLEIVYRDPDHLPFDQIMSRMLLAAAHNPETYEQIYNLIHDED